ncbi:hypothetical protein KIN20_001200 [Parelaphostrongylus tenuis]|uniref:Uncharacterized protein n=1 Tax=Parelaphostrongylus tenuis TaxID=148309 RepID=A0AAD5QGS8_PARTN|nr:hypothetical protein KIN20_001200 [Parelaphostrongylus tenuis]
MHPEPISPDASPATLTYPTTADKRTTRITNIILIPITPDWNLPPLTTVTMKSDSPIPTDIVVSHVTSRPETTHERTTIAVTPDSILQTISLATMEGHTYTITQDQSLVTVTSPERPSSLGDVSTLVSSSETTTSNMIRHYFGFVACHCGDNGNLSYCQYRGDY